MNEAIQTKLTAARTRLILDKPFLGALVLRLPMKHADPKWCPTSATDARHFYYNPDYIDALSLDQTQFVLAHEALHCALSHFARRQHRIKIRWDLACDYAINPLLLKDGLTPPPGVNIMLGFEQMTAEEIYPYIDENTNDEPMDQHLYDNQPQEPPPNMPPKQDPADEPSSGQNDDQQDADPSAGASQPPPSLSLEEQQNLSVQWQQRLAGAAQQAMQAGKLDGAMARMVDHLLQPQLPWRMLLARYVTAIARDDFSYMRPSRREGSAILPSLRSHHLEVTIVLDISGSVSTKEMHQFLAEVDAIKGQMKARLTLHACDAKLAEQGPWTFEPWENLKLPTQFNGGGGTDFRPIFEWLEQTSTVPDMLIYFTDAKGKFPTTEPHYPVLWLIKGKQKTPWGQRVQLN